MTQADLAPPKAKRKKPSSPSAMSLERCRKLGYQAQVVERWIPRAFRRVDLFGGLDIVALDGHPGCLGIQACAGGDASTHCHKLEQEPRLVEWLRHENRLQIWSWSRKGKAGKRKLWTCRVIQAHLFHPDNNIILWSELGEDQPPPP